MLMTVERSPTPMSTAPPPDEPLFTSARLAVSFAVNRTGAPARPAMAKIADKTSSHGLLLGLDAVAQAGMILGMLHSLGPFQMALLIAGTAQRTIPCPCRRACCSGHTVNLTWRNAITDIAEVVYRRNIVRADDRIRHALLVKAYGGGFMSFAKVAKDLDCDPEAISKHYRALHRWLFGQRGIARHTGDEGVDPAAWAAAETVLRDYGIVG